MSVSASFPLPKTEFIDAAPSTNSRATPFACSPSCRTSFARACAWAGDERIDAAADGRRDVRRRRAKNAGQSILSVMAEDGAFQRRWVYELV
jgi:hypothetical protein